MMELRILFTDPLHIALTTNADVNSRHTVCIKDPFIIQYTDYGRKIVHTEGYSINYEQYCVEIEGIIMETLQFGQLEKASNLDTIIIEGCKEPPNFKALCLDLMKQKISVSSSCNIIIKNCSFYGSLYVNSLTQWISSIQRRQPDVFFNIVLEEQTDSKLSHHDKAKLALLNNTAVFPDHQSNAVVRRFTDDQLLLFKNQPTLESKTREVKEYPTEKEKQSNYLTNPSYLFHRKLQGKATPQNILMDFFSQAHQQQSDYTCGPAAVKMVLDYYWAMKRRQFCNESIFHYDSGVDNNNKTVNDLSSVWEQLNNSLEIELAQLFQTTEEVGSDAYDMRQGLIKFGIPVIDDAGGLSNVEYDSGHLNQHKVVLVDKFKEILNLGIPIIVNMQNKDGVGHFEVIIGIDQNKIILAEPGGALDCQIAYEQLSKETFVDRWKNMSGEFHGRFVIIPPNQASANEIEHILSDVPHFSNGEKKSSLSNF